METTLYINEFEFHKARKWRNNLQDLQETWRIVNENLTVQAIIFQKENNLCLPLPQRFEKTFAHKSKH